MTTEPNRPNARWHRQEPDTVLRSLASNAERGLAASEAAARLARTGPNEIEGARRPGLWRLIAHQFSDFMIALLLAAAVISGLVGDLIDTIAIVVIVLLNAAVGVIQEFRAQRAIAALKRMSAPTARVVRDGAMRTVAARELVPGDIVLLEAGDAVAADLRLIEAVDLGADESALTGESVPVAKRVSAVDSDEPAAAPNMAFKSTLLTRGRARGVVVATGASTRIGQIADLLRRERSARTPLQQRLERFGRRIALAVLAVCAVVFTTGLLQGQPALLMFLTALSLAVAAVPEALPAVITMSLGLGARRLSELKALVRRLPAVETLGSVTYICADKTGTLTENRMALGALLAAGQRSEGLDPSLPTPLRERIGQVLALCNDVEIEDGELKGDPTERALVEAARAAGFDKAELEQDMPRIAELPFEAARRCMVTLNRTPAGSRALIKGAPERIIEGCLDALTASGRVPLDPGTLATAGALAAEGFRVLALACRDDARAGDHLEQGWTFLGLVGLLDPPRPETHRAIRQCRDAGIVPVMITGDHPATALSIARKLEISDGQAQALTGTELAALSDDELEQRIERVRVYARVGPEQKIRIVEALKNKGHFVAMTGDGVNDAPALKNASIGIAMGERGTEVAREAAEMVLLDDNFATIVNAVHEGRRIYDDIRKFVKYTMTSNSGEIWVLFLAPFLGLPVPLLPLHILWINLVTDGLPGLALSAEPAERDAMRRPPRPPDESIFAHGMIVHILWVGLTIGALTLSTQAWAWHQGSAHWQTMTFTVLVFSQLFHCLAIRSERYSLASIGLASNRPLVLAIAVTIAAQLAVIYVPAMNRIFHTQPLSGAELAACVAVASVVFVAVEAEKLVRRRRIASPAAARATIRRR